MAHLEPAGANERLAAKHLPTFTVIRNFK